MTRLLRLPVEQARQIADSILFADDTNQAIDEMLQSLGELFALRRIALVSLSISPVAARRADREWQCPETGEPITPYIEQLLADEERFQRLCNGECLTHATDAGQPHDTDDGAEPCLILPVSQNGTLLAVLIFMDENLTAGWDPDDREGLQLITKHLSHRLIADRAATYQAILDHTTDLVSIVRPDKERPQFISASHTSVLGLTLDELADLTLWDPLHPSDIQSVKSILHSIALTPGADASTDVRMRSSDGDWRDIHFMGINRLDHPDLQGILVSGRDVTERKRAERRLAWLAGHDPLTRLPNRSRFLRMLESTLDHVAESDDASLAVFFLDLDGFKRVNDAFGHAAGDKLLKQVASRLHETVRDEDTIARIGGDEFVVLLPNMPDVDTAEHMAQRLIDAMRFPFTTETGAFTVEVSIGIAYEGIPEETPDGYLAAADLALYAAKNAGRGQAIVYTPELGEAPAVFRPRQGTGPLSDGPSYGA